MSLTNLFKFSNFFLRTKYKTSPLPHNLIRLNYYLEFAENIILNSKSTNETFTGLLKIQQHLCTCIQSNLTDKLICSTGEIQIEYDYLKLPSFNEVPISENNVPSFSLDNIAIIAHIWNKERLANTFKGIGKSNNNPFIQNKHFPNNFFTYYYPFCVMETTNGNHSTAASLFEKNTSIFPTKIIDGSVSFEAIFFDGTYFRYSKSNKVISEPNYKEVGIIFEIGRLIFRECSLQLFQNHCDSY